jgi:hypothetical protein
LVKKVRRSNLGLLLLNHVTSHAAVRVCPYWEQGMELELRKLEDAVESVHHELLYLRDR